MDITVLYMPINKPFDPAVHGVCSKNSIVASSRTVEAPFQYILCAVFHDQQASATLFSQSTDCTLDSRPSLVERYPAFSRVENSSNNQQLPFGCIRAVRKHVWVFALQVDVQAGYILWLNIGYVPQAIAYYARFIRRQPVETVVV